MKIDELNENQKTAIEITSMIVTGCVLTKDEAISELTKLAHLILDNAEQFHPSPEIPEISDEEIGKAFPVTSSHQMDTDSWNNRLRQDGAEWYRTKLREGGKKDEPPQSLGQAWECPRCGTIHAFWVSQCGCPPRTYTSTTCQGTGDNQ